MTTNLKMTLARVITSLMAGLIALGVAVGVAAPSNATTGGCNNGRCTVYLSKAETRALSEGSAPGLPAGLPWQIRGSYFALVQGHRWFAGQYANRGWCSSFRLSIYPWESQGYNGYRC